MAYKVKAFVRGDGTKVKAHTGASPTLGAKERKRRAAVAKRELLPRAISAAGEKGFTETAEALTGKPGVKSPEKLAGWLKKEALHRGVLSSKHPYTGRKKKRGK